tara:strand:+ start:3742 stop:4515 length:774 start_codon:yes stop_codon:yes gene_type:complete
LLRHVPEFSVRIADGPCDIRQAQGLRYDVFITELGGDGASVDHAEKLESDRFDGFATHLMLEDLAPAAPRRLVGVYRLMTDDMARGAGGFYSAAEFDLAPLLESKRSLLELGRSCLHVDYRGGAGMLKLWAALADYVAAQKIDLMFGVASFSGVNTADLAQPLSYLRHFHSAAPHISPIARTDNAVALDVIPKDRIDRKAAILAIPTLIKAYLRLGGVVGQGAYVDYAFNTTDVCLILDTELARARTKTMLHQGDSL